MRLKRFSIIAILAIMVLAFLIENFKLSLLEYKILFLMSLFGLFIFVFCTFKYIFKIEDLKEKILVQHSQLKTIIDDTSFITYLCNVDGTILLVNKNFYSIFKSNSDSFIGTNLKDYCEGENISKIIDENNCVKETKLPLFIERKLALKGLSGIYRVMKYPVFDPDGNVVRIVCVNKNIDKEKELENRKNTFVSTLIHDLKTPIIAQIKTLDLILGRKLGNINDKQEYFLSQIKDSCNYMSDLIFNILDTYLYDEGQANIYQEYFSLIELVELTVLNLTNLYKEKGQTIKINTINNTTIFADKFQIQRVITNLLSNSITYGFQNSIIEINISEKDNSICLAIRNHSPYIPEEKLLYIFDKYNSVTNSKNLTCSSGLGLYLSKQIIDAHNGNIYASSTPDQTCTFGFSVPKS